MLEKVIQLPECLSNVRKALFKLCSASCSTKTDGFACKPNAWRMGQEDQEFEVGFTHTVRYPNTKLSKFNKTIKTKRRQK